MISFSEAAFEEYQSWAACDKKVFDKINTLIRDIARNPFRGLGKPEPLKHEYSGYWSRRITQSDRLIYSVNGGTITIMSCKSHYGGIVSHKGA